MIGGAIVTRSEQMHENTRPPECLEWKEASGIEKGIV